LEVEVVVELRLVVEEVVEELYSSHRSQLQLRVIP
jgi:hypothetical protein